MKQFSRRLRGALGTAVTWATTWAGGSLAITAGQFLLMWNPYLATGLTWSMALVSAAGMGICGFFSGLAFSSYVELAHRDKNILDLSVSRFALGGFLVAACSWPIALMGIGAVMGSATALLPTMNPSLILAIALRFGAFGGVSAGGTLRIAQNASRRLASSSIDQLEEEQNEVAALIGESAPARSS